MDMDLSPTIDTFVRLCTNIDSLISWLPMFTKDLHEVYVH